VEYCKPNEVSDIEHDVYMLKLKAWRDAGGESTGTAPPDEPEPPPPKDMPPYLDLYLQCKRWGCLPSDLLRQPAWSFDMTDLAGMVYERERGKHATLHKGTTS
jgi:hypothetical protein